MVLILVVEADHGPNDRMRIILVLEAMGGMDLLMWQRVLKGS